MKNEKLTTVDDLLFMTNKAKKALGGSYHIGIKQNKDGNIRFTNIIQLCYSSFEGLNIEIEPIYDKKDV